jgi:coproporphyrinogen III oxidase
MIELALFQPEIPQNAGTLLRLGACLGVEVNIIEPCGFALSNRRLKRAGMDYLSHASFRRWQDWAAFHGSHDQAQGKRLILLTPNASVSYVDFQFSEDDVILVGRESDGFPPEILKAIPHHIMIPMQVGYRSLNVATAASMVVGEALRQTKKFSIPSGNIIKALKLSTDKKQEAHGWFQELQQQIIDSLEVIEEQYGASPSIEERVVDKPGKFQKTPWEYKGEGGGVSAVLKGRIFEKAGVNVSCIKGEFSGDMKEKVPGALENPQFWACGISLVIHPWSPFIPTIHFNTRVIETTRHWFGGGIDITPMNPEFKEKDAYAQELKDICDRQDPAYYERFKAWCDSYFYLQNRQEPRGVGGIFYDNLNSENWQKDFLFTQSIGQFFLKFYPALVRKYIEKPWSIEDRQYQLLKRGRYVEYNLLYDRGTLFGLKTGGNIEAILMSLPPKAAW